MQEFYKRALVAFIALVIAGALVACFCIYQGYPTAPLIPRKGSAVRWHLASFTDASSGGASTIRIDPPTQKSLVFDFKLRSMRF